jgi:hypothetical protein
MGLTCESCFYRSSANILSSTHPNRVSFIDFEGSLIIPDQNHTQDALVGKKLLAVNARLPELGDKTAINPFAADVWQLADMFLQVRRQYTDIA